MHSKYSFCEIASYISTIFINSDCAQVNPCQLGSCLNTLVRAGGNGTAGTAMAVPVFEGEKWRRLDSNLACVIECPLRALRRSLRRLRGL